MGGDKGVMKVLYMFTLLEANLRNDSLLGKVLKSTHLSTGRFSRTAFGCFVRTETRYIVEGERP